MLIDAFQGLFLVRVDGFLRVVEEGQGVGRGNIDAMEGDYIIFHNL